jgi:hypothetical protein
MEFVRAANLRAHDYNFSIFSIMFVIIHILNYDFVNSELCSYSYSSAAV